MMRVICIGECMTERGGGGAAAFAGDAFNVAAQIKQAAPEIEVAFASATGDDVESRAMRAAWSRFGVDGSLSPAIAGGRIGAYRAEIDSAAERRFSYDRSDSAARGWFTALRPSAEAMAGADLVFLTGISLAILPPGERLTALSFVADLKPKILAFDPNVRPALWESRETMRAVLEAAMGQADILLPSRDDLLEVWGVGDSEAQLERCRGLGPTEGVLTLGAAGCLLSADGEPTVRLPSVTAKAVDTAGAGDAFDGAYLASRLQGRPPADAARLGLERAALAVAFRGALPMEIFPCR
ncbi:MAG TPA: sugar kinase [Caulobacteraceae bacterium]|jgi:2-dehydro-3-deoxygluconokinase